MKRFNDSKTMSLLLTAVVALLLTAATANADFAGGPASNLGATINTRYKDLTPVLSPDGLELYFMSDRPGGYGGYDIWVTKRRSKEDLWGEPVNLGPQINMGEWEQAGSISADGLTLYFGSGPGGYGFIDLYTTTRSTREAPWAQPVNLGPTVNSSATDDCPIISPDGLELFFYSDRGGGCGGIDIWVARRATQDEPWSNPVNLGSTVNSSANEWAGLISPDGLRLFITSRWRGGFGSHDTWVTSRSSKTAAWGPLVNPGPSLNTPYSDEVASMSRDGRTLYFTSDQPGGYGDYDIWEAPIIPIVDFNGDGIVDMKDFSKLGQHWGQDEPSVVDVGPMPWGDGRVDIHDIAALVEQWLTYPGTVAYWKLDETEGFTAHDSAGTHDGFVMSINPLWRPTDGIVNGTLELDGIDDFVSAPFVFNPAEGTFSVFAWVKGGAPGQVIVSQQPAATYPGSTWLAVDALNGKLLTELMFPQPALHSESVITDGQWHEIGLVWDGSRRHLYVDGKEVAIDGPGVGAVASNGEIYLGVGKSLEAGTFWSGLIDDVRIYDRAVTP